MNGSASLAPVPVVLLVTPESTPSVLYGMAEGLTAAGQAWEKLTGEPSRVRRMQPRLVADNCLTPA